MAESNEGTCARLHKVTCERNEQDVGRFLDEYDIYTQLQYPVRTSAKNPDVLLMCTNVSNVYISA